MTHDQAQKSPRRCTYPTALKSPGFARTGPRQFSYGPKCRRKGQTVAGANLLAVVLFGGPWVTRTLDLRIERGFPLIFWPGYGHAHEVKRESWRSSRSLKEQKLATFWLRWIGPEAFRFRGRFPRAYARRIANTTPTSWCRPAQLRSTTSRCRRRSRASPREQAAPDHHDADARPRTAPRFSG